MTARRELPCIKTGKRGVGYRLIELIRWQEARLQPETICTLEEHKAINDDVRRKGGHPYPNLGSSYL